MQKWHNLNILVCIIFTGMFQALNAQDIQLNATVSKNTVGLNESFQYSIQVSGSVTNLPDPVFPGSDDLAIIGGPSSSTNIQFVNGKMSAAKTLTYVMQARRIGKIIIPAATAESNGKEFSSNQITLTVTKTSPQPKQPNQSQPKATSDTEISGENLFLKVVADKRNAYQNEQVIITYKLYFRVSVRSYNVDKLPANTGFWTEEFEIPAQPIIEKEVVNGIAYQVATLRKVAVFPTRTGKLEIEPMVITVDALVKSRRGSRSIFDSFFDDPFGRTVRKSISSKPLQLTVKSLPTVQKPAGFNGEVGTYKLKVSADKTELKANEAVSVKVVVSGSGNIKLLKPPALKLPPDMEVYDPKESTRISRKNNKISGSKTVEYIVVPRYAGNYEIKPIRLSYFSPNEKRYVTIVSKPITLNILPGSVVPGAPLSAGNLSKQDVELLGEDIRFIKDTAEFLTPGSVIYKRWYYPILYMLPILGLVFSWILAHRRDKMRSDVQLAQKRRAGKISSRHLSTAKKYLKPDQDKQFYREISLALQSFICNKLNIQLTDFNPERVKSKLESVKVPEEVVTEYLNNLQESDFRQFSGSSSEFAQMQQFFERSRMIIAKLDKYL